MLNSGRSFYNDKARCLWLSYIELKDRDADATGRAWASQANEMTTADVTGKQRGANLRIQ